MRGIVSRMTGGLLRTGALLLLLPAAATAHVESIRDPDGQQDRESICRTCMPSAGYNGMVIVRTHGFQNAGPPASIPEDQLCISGFCLAEVANDLGFAFATNSYSKSGLAVVQGRADILDLVQIVTREKGPPRKGVPVGRLGRRSHHRAQRRAAPRSPVCFRPVLQPADPSARSSSRSAIWAMRARRAALHHRKPA